MQHSRIRLRYGTAVRIGVFDSGIGGEAVAARLRELIPNAVVITANDRSHVPYGSRSEAEVHRLTSLAIRPLLAASCDVIVLACNTATAAAVEHLRRDHPSTPFVGLEPMVKPASALTRTGGVVVCATPATLASPRYQRLKSRWASTVNVIEPDCSDWAAAVERDEADSVDLEPLQQHIHRESADVVVLACTHYHWLKARIQQVAGPTVTVLEPSDAVAAQVRRITEAAEPDPHERVREIIASVPAGRVATYGDVAAIAGLGSPRQVGWILREDGSDLPWHRILRADGTPAPQLRAEQLHLLRTEGVLTQGQKISLRRYRWDPDDDADHTPGRG